MNKSRERRILDSVFRRMDGVYVTESEQPDFVCGTGASFSFGVEVAEFYLSESVARLKRIDGYAGDLLKNEAYRHKDDEVRIAVEDVIWRRGQTGEECKMKAIVGEEHTVETVVERFCELVATKNAKHSEYRRNVATIDLVIDDADFALGSYSIEEWVRSFRRLETGHCITKSPFREIYVVTAHKPSHRVCVPLRAVLFVSEISAFQSIFKEFQKESLETLTLGEYLVLLARYLAGQFDAIELAEHGGKLCFVFGSVAVAYSEDAASLEVRDISLDVVDGRERLSDAVVGSLDGQFGEYVYSRRPSIFCCVPIQFDAWLAGEDGCVELSQSPTIARETGK